MKFIKERDKLDDKSNIRLIITESDISNLSSMTRNFSCNDIKEFIKQTYFAIIKNIKNDNTISNSCIWWHSLDLTNKPLSTISKYSLYSVFVSKKIHDWLNYNDHEQDFMNKLYIYWYIQLEQVTERQKIEDNFAYQSYAAGLSKRFRDSENIQLAKNVFIYVSETKIAQAATDGIAEEVKDRSKIFTKKGFDKTGEGLYFVFKKFY